MWTLIKIAWRNLFRQRRRTAGIVVGLAHDILVAQVLEALQGNVDARAAAKIQRRRVNPRSTACENEQNRYQAGMKKASADAHIPARCDVTAG